uniref:Uncharacterized protein n=1 Tax=Arundo donax TaxID=35708 RepID=A0A0A9GRR8_ARUDO
MEDSYISIETELISRSFQVKYIVLRFSRGTLVSVSHNR